MKKHYNFTEIRNNRIILIVILLSFVTVSCSFLNKKGKYSEYTSEDIKRFIGDKIKAPNFFKRALDGGTLEDSKEAKEKLGVNGTVLAFYVNESSQSEAVLQVSSFSTIEGTKSFMNIQTEGIAESGGKIISREERKNGATVVFRKKSADGPIFVIDCREGLCLLIKPSVGEKDNDIGLSFYKEISKEEIF